MASSLRYAAAVLLFASLASAQYGGYSYGSPTTSNGNSDSPSNTAQPTSAAAAAAAAQVAYYAHIDTLRTSHAVLATLAFGLMFPLGGIVVRVFSFRNLWVAHASLQVLGLILYIAAFGLGIYLATTFDLLSDPHAIIGIVLFILVIMQPLSGLLHHFEFVKRQTRNLWSYPHIWLGRVAITLGIINGGLGLQLASESRTTTPPMGAIIAYAVLAGIMWLVYVAAAVWGEQKKRTAGQGKRMEEGDFESHSTQPKEERMTASP